MKRLAILCTSLAILASAASNASAQTYNVVSAGTGYSNANITPTPNSSIQNSQFQNQQTLKTANNIQNNSTVNQKNIDEKSESPLARKDNLDNPEYVRKRMIELEKALYNKTKKELLEKKGEDKTDDPLTMEMLEEQFQEKLLEREITEKIESELSLKQFGREFFANGAQTDSNLFANSAPSNYQLGPGDSLKIIIWSELGDETVYDVQVNPEGQVYIPMIGVIGVSGKTVGQFESIVLGKFSSKFEHCKGQVTLNQVRTIMIFVAGEVEKPGAMMVSGLTTAFSALYHAGGPTEKGSMRNIRVIESNGRTKEIDLYKYFMSGDRRQDISIMNGDTIFVPTTEKRVTVNGTVTRPAIYEILGETSLEEVLHMAGNILPEAYAGRVSITRFTGNERRKSFDVNCSDKNAMASFKVLPGDVINVERSNGIIENAVTIEGPVNKPGNYSANGLTVSELIKLAGGMISETANYKHGQIVRKTTGGRDEILSFDVNKALDGDNKHNIVLKPLDEVKLFAEEDITNEIFDIYIGGAVRNPKIYKFHEGMKLADLVLLANGLNTDASGEAEIARKSEGNTSVIIKANIKNALENKDSSDNVTLQALDKVNIIGKGDVLMEPEVVILKGQVMKPGAYALTHRGETLSSLIQRAGGLTDRAYPEGAIFMRNLNNISTNDQLETTISVQNELFREANLDLRSDLIKAGAKDTDISGISSDVRGDGITKQMMDKAGIVSETLSNQQQNPEAMEQDDFAKALEKGSRKLEQKQEEEASKNGETVKTRIAVSMAEIMRGNCSKEEDIELLDGDEITVPVMPHTVSVLGAVMNPTTIMYNPKANASYYINRAGGYTSHCDHRRTVVVKANGEVMRLRNIRKISRGDIILVPPKARIVQKDTLKDASSIAQILGNLAVTYKVVNDSK